MRRKSSRLFLVAGLASLCALSAALAYVLGYGGALSPGTTAGYVRARLSDPPAPRAVLDKAAYDAKMFELANYPRAASAAAATSTAAATTSRPWPPKTVYPNAGALLPFNRIVAYYGNFYSTGMGVLGAYPPQEMLRRLQEAAKEWEAADPSTPVIPAIHYIAVTAQGSPGADGMYRVRMPDDQVEKALELASQIHGLVFLDFQVGLSTVQKELPQYAKYLALPNVHVGIDPEFSMKDGAPPGREIGTLDASDVNWAANYLAGIVRENNLPSKILVVHRFTEDMVTHYEKIAPLPEVEIVMDMDGWGYPAKKINTYDTVMYPEPVQFTGFKLFYKNDLLPPSTAMLAPAQILKLVPRPIYIQYQ